MNVLKRRMFQAGGLAESQEIPSKVLSREVRDLGFRNPYQEITQIEQQGDLFFERIYDRNGRLKRERLIERDLSPTGDIRQALARQKTNEMVKGIVGAAPYVLGGGLLGAGIKTALGSTIGKKALSGFGGASKALVNFLAPYKLNPKFVKNPNYGKTIKGKTDRDGNPVIDTRKKILEDRGATEAIPKSLKEIQVKPVTSTAYGLGATSAVQEPVIDALTTSPDEVQDAFEQQILDSDMSQLEKMKAIESAKAQKDPIAYAQSIADFNADLDAILEEETPKVATTTSDNNTGDDSGNDLGNEQDNGGVAAAQTTANSLSNFFSSSAFNDALRNIGGSLVREGRFGAGLASGAASFADEQEAKSLLEQERMAKLMASGGLDFKDKLSLDKEVRDTKNTLAEKVRDYNNAEAAYQIAQEVLDIAEGNADLATFASKFGATLDNFLAAMNLKTLQDYKDLDPVERAKILLGELTNRNIKEILGESGRTISNIDRDIAKRVVGNLDLTKIDSLASLKKTVNNAIQPIIQTGNKAQREIISSSEFLVKYLPSLFEDDPELLEIMQKDFGANANQIKTNDFKNLKPRVVSSTLRG